MQGHQFVDAFLRLAVHRPCQQIAGTGLWISPIGLKVSIGNTGEGRFAAFAAVGARFASPVRARTEALICRRLCAD